MSSLNCVGIRQDHWRAQLLDILSELRRFDVVHSVPATSGHAAPSARCGQVVTAGRSVLGEAALLQHLGNFFLQAFVCPSFARANRSLQVAGYDSLRSARLCLLCVLPVQRGIAGALFWRRYCFAGITVQGAVFRVCVCGGGDWSTHDDHLRRSSGQIGRRQNTCSRAGGTPDRGTFLRLRRRLRRIQANQGAGEDGWENKSPGSVAEQALSDDIRRLPIIEDWQNRPQAPAPRG